MAQNTNPKDVSTRSPFAGCTIVIVGICAMVFLVCFVIWNLFKLDDEISKFTTDTAIATPVPDLVDNAAAFNRYKAKVELFKSAVENQQEAQLRVTAEDINLTIAADARFKDLRKTFSVTSIQDGKLHVQISFPLRGQPMSGEMRYLNGTMVAVPSLAGPEIILTIEQINSPVADVPEGFIGQMSPYRIAQRYMDDETLGPWMAKLTTLSIDEDAVILSYVPSAAPGPKDISPFVKRALALFAIFLVLFLATIVAVIIASRHRRTEAPVAADDTES